MAALLLEILKLIVLFLLIGSIVGFSHAGGGKVVAAGAKGLRGRCRPASARS